MTKPGSYCGDPCFLLRYGQPANSNPVPVIAEKWDNANDEIGNLSRAFIAAIGP
jgi:hypothetical protein